MTTLKQCDHKFVDSNVCLKCGWAPPGSNPCYTVAGVEQQHREMAERFDFGIGERQRLAELLATHGAAEYERGRREGTDTALRNAVAELLSLVSWSECGAPVRSQVHKVRKLLDQMPLPPPPEPAQ